MKKLLAACTLITVGLGASPTFADHKHHEDHGRHHHREYICHEKGRHHHDGRDFWGEHRYYHYPAHRTAVSYNYYGDRPYYDHSSYYEHHYYTRPSGYYRYERRPTRTSTTIRVHDGDGISGRLNLRF